MFSGFDYTAQDCPTLRERELRELPPFVDQDVKGLVNNPRLCRAEVLQEIEIGLAIHAEGYHLSVDHRIVWEVLQCPCDVGKLLVEHVLSARIECDFAAMPYDFKPVPSSLIS